MTGAAEPLHAGIHDAVIGSTVRQALGNAIAENGEVKIDPETVEQDLARLVLALMEFLRRLMELQAVRRLEAGSLTPEEEDRLGETLMRAHQKILEMASKFGLEEGDLAVDLGPLGRLF